MTIVSPDHRSEIEPVPDPFDPERLADIDAVPDDGLADDDFTGEVEPYDPDPWRRPESLAGLERFAGRPLPTLTSIRASTKWWMWALSRSAVQLVVHAPELFFHQVPHVFRGFGRWGQVYAQWRAKPEWMRAARQYESNKAADKIAHVERHKRNATRLTWVVILLAGLGSFFAFALGLGGYLLLALFAVVLAADVVGRRGAPEGKTVQIMPTSTFREGAPSHMVIADVKAVLVRQGHDEATTAVVEPKVGQYGLSVSVHSRREMSEEDVGAIERGLQTYRGAVQPVAEHGNAAVTELRIWWTDPLQASVTPCRYAPNSRTIAHALDLGYGVGGVALLLSFMRTNVIMVGGPGSGKSSALWSIIDGLSVCRDVVLHAIDLSGGPMARTWGEVFSTRAFDRDEAKALLLREIARAHRRTVMLAERSEPREGIAAPESENWEPTDGKFHIIIIDELPLLAADEELRELYAEHQRIGRKAGCTSVVATQDLAGDTIKATSLRKYPSTTILLPCSREDVVTALGGGKIKEGWAPHRFTPAEGEDINDAGKCFVKSGRQTKPVPWRFARLDDIGEIHSRALERIQAGRPADDDEPIEATDAVVVPRVLAGLAAVFRADGTPDFMLTETVVERMRASGFSDMTDRKLADAVREHHISTHRPRIGGESRRGYQWVDVEAALRALK